jgi:hypothetical protein
MNCRNEVDHESMARSLVEEIKSLLKMSSITDVTSVYFGGGAWGFK